MCKCGNNHYQNFKQIKSVRKEIQSNLLDLQNYRSKSNFLKSHMEDRVFISIAHDMAMLSHCVSRQVGVVIVRDGRILSTGVNGTAIDDVNCDSVFPEENFDKVAHRQWADLNEIHAEMNAINFAAKFGIKLDGATLYSSLQPCMECSKNIPAVGIKRIVFDQMYDRVDNFDDQQKELKRKGVKIQQIMDENQIQQLLAKINQDKEMR